MRDVPWYRSHRDLTKPSNWTIKLYQSLQDIPKQHTTLIRNANLVILGSYVPDGVAIAEWVTTQAQGVTAFYDIDTPVTLAGLDQGLEYLDDAINHFIDEHPEVDVKNVTTTIGMFDGKFKDFALIVNLWY